MSEGIDGKDAVGLYLEGIAKTPLLSAEEEVVLAKTIELGLYAEHILNGDVTLAERGKKAKRPTPRSSSTRPRAKRHAAIRHRELRLVSRWRSTALADAVLDMVRRATPPDPGGGEVRLHQGFKVSTTHLVGAAVDHGASPAGR